MSARRKVQSDQPDAEPETADLVESTESDQPDAEPSGNLTVTVPFAYAHAVSGEMRQLVRGDVINPDQFQQESVDHLRSIGFLVHN